jgi:hypothetical protein
MKRIFVLLLSTFAVTSLWAGTVPSQITYQGTLKESGVPVDGTRTMLFRVTNLDGSAVYWSSGNTDVPVSQGLFSALLTPVGADWQNIVPYIETSVGGQLLLPRVPISANAYALMSQSVVDGAITNAKIAPGSVAGTQMVNQTITATQIANGTITGAQIGNQTIAGTQLVNGAIGPAQLAANAVTLPALDPTVSNYLIPVNMVALFVNACPSGWAEVTALRGRTPFGYDPGNLGQFTLGQQGGFLNHTHTISPDGGHSHTLGIPEAIADFWAFGTQQGSGSGEYKISNFAQTHSVSGQADHTHTGATGSYSSLPPYVTMLYCSKL